MPTTKKFLDAAGVSYLIGLLDNYPDNELLGTVITAIQDALDEKANKTANISSFTNDAGYLTLSTLPKYDGTVV